MENNVAVKGLIIIFAMFKKNTRYSLCLIKALHKMGGFLFSLDEQGPFLVQISFLESKESIATHVGLNRITQAG